MHNLKANHNKDYSVVKTFKPPRLTIRGIFMPECFANTLFYLQIDSTVILAAFGFCPQFTKYLYLIARNLAK